MVRTRFGFARRRVAPGLVAAALVLGWATAAGAMPASVAAFGSPEDVGGGRIVLMEMVTALWFFVLGTVIGSFLNVVVYRLPLGMSLRHPPSRCPHCQTPIAKTDNLPVIGWLRLRGRCRSCRAPIAVRYPLVEAATGVLFLGLLLCDVLSGGATIPLREPNASTGAVWTLWDPQWDLIGMFLYHCVLLCTLLCLGLMAYDGQSTPPRLVLPVLAIGLLLPVVWPDLHPVPFRVPRPEGLAALRWATEWRLPQLSYRTFTAGVGLDGAVDGLAGLLAGAALGGLLSLAEPPNPPAGRKRWPVMAAMALAGTFLGWQAAVSVAAFSILTFLPTVVLARAICRRRPPLPLAAFCVMAAAAQIVLWRHLAAALWWPSYDWPLPWMAAAVAAIALLSWTARVLPTSATA